ncbi:ADP-ribosylation factor GTPase-activating protein 2 [Bacillus rossius redtenbacheri]|uniref:ADP-ribosylation factor GTPase-activating protein 2 n=1 Tax=Bacillus rossius redtenbacheri TaxID=93214 RepID=UPI002FDD1F3F
MADQCPNKNDIQLVFKRLRAITHNKVCFDCDAKNPTWASVTYGVFICIDCSAVHRGLGVHLSFVRSTQLDTNWTWLQLRQMQLGGNANALTFFRQHNCATTDAQQKYNSRAAQLYREKLHHLAIQAMRLHGTKLHLEAHTEPAAKTEEKEDDFFSEHSKIEAQVEENLEDNLNRANGSLQNLAPGTGPSVEAALNASPADVSHDRKPTIGVRKPVSKRPGMMGGKKGGLGAQKVKTNFADLERDAARADQLKVQAAEEARLVSERSAEEEQKRMASMRLAYQDLSVQQKKEEEKLKKVDPKKAQQIERLGMGFASRTGVSHSALSDMKVIDQESPSKAAGSSRSAFDRDESFFDDYSFSSGFGMYKSGAGDRSLDSLFPEGSAGRDRHSPSKGWVAVEPESQRPAQESRPRRAEPPAPPPDSDQAQKKFGSAKAISSEQFFGDSADSSWERKANLTRFEGSSSISSADYFGAGPGGGPGARGGGGGLTAQLHTPDFDDVRESVRQGVTKVAGKLSSMANGVMSSIQDRYGY